jgi:aminomethyltransferase
MILSGEVLPLSSNAESAGVRKTALNAAHRELGARMVDFNGWDMPVEYPANSRRKAGGLIAEHLIVRNSVGLFDVSHMGDIRLHGPQALRAVQHMTMNDAAHLAVGQAQYSAMLYPTGTFVDDVLVHRLGEDDYLIVINAGTREKDFDWVRDAARNFDCVVEDLSDRYTQIAIQGPNAWRTLQKLTDADLTKVKFYWFTHGTVGGLPNTLIARTGYTAEDGFEIYIPSDETTSVRVWKEVLDSGEEFGILPCGLGARNTLRLEGALSLYGHEISDTITPWEARLDRFLKIDKGEFIGHSALVNQKQRGLKNILVGLEAIDRGIPRDGYNVRDHEGRRIGSVTSGSPAPFLKKNIALAYVPLEHSAEGTELSVECRSLHVKCKVVPTPFYKRPRPTPAAGSNALPDPKRPQ